MTDRLTAMEARLAALECAMAELRAAVSPPEPTNPNHPLANHPLIWKKPPREVLEAHHAAVNKALGIDGLQPVGPEKLREMMIADGIDPNGTEFSQGIVEMREE